MRPGENAEVIFESTLEARIAAQMLDDAGRPDLVAAMVPPVVPARIGRLGYLRAIGELQLEGHTLDTSEYVVADTRTGLAVVRALMLACKRPSVEDIPPPTRAQYLGQMLLGFAQKVEARQAQPRVMQVGPLTVVGVTGEQAVFLVRRAAFTQQYLKERGWDATNPTIEQVMEVRSQEGWKNPLGGEE